MLPKITSPVFEFTIPSTSKKVKMRPMLVKEEKILLIAKTSGERFDIMNAIKQVVQNCIMTEGVDVDKLAIFDVEFLFLQLRAISISNITKVSYRDNEDEDEKKVYEFDINLDKIKVNMKDAPDTKITVSSDIMIEMNWPTAGFYSNKEIYEAGDDKAFDLMIDDCLNKIYKNDETFDAKLASPEERREFIDNLPAKAGEQLRNFLSKVPTLKHEIKYKNSKGTERTITLDTLDDFFTL